jgi:hypothetical protein
MEVNNLDYLQDSAQTNALFDNCFSNSNDINLNCSKKELENDAFLNLFNDDNKLIDLPYFDSLSSQYKEINNPSKALLTADVEPYHTEMKLETKTKTKHKSYINNSLNKPSVLKQGHKLARGRARIIQLRNMTKEEREEEHNTLLEKNRLAAIACRKRKKVYENNLHYKLLNFIDRDKEQQDTIKQLNIELQLLKTQTKL